MSPLNPLRILTLRGPLSTRAEPALDLSKWLDRPFTLAIDPNPAYSAPMAVRARDDSEQFELESCTIERWRGYVTSSFVATLEDGTLVAQSGDFRARGGAPPPDTGPARAAYDELCAELRRLGWARSEEPAEAWYGSRFTRLVAVPVDTSPPDEPEAAETVDAPAEPEAPRHVEPERRILREAAAPWPPPRVEPPVEPPVEPRVEPPVEPRVERTREQLPVTPPRVLAAAPAAPVQVQRQRPERNRIITFVSVAGLLSALAFSAYLLFVPGGRHVPRAGATPAAAAAKPKPAAEASVPAVTPPAAPTPAPKAVHLVISANAPSWLEIRRRSAAGRTLFSGELAPGQPIRLSGRRLWARFGSASNLTIRADGRVVALTGTIERVFVAAKH